MNTDHQYGQLKYVTTCTITSAIKFYNLTCKQGPSDFFVYFSIFGIRDKNSCENPTQCWLKNAYNPLLYKFR